MEEEEEEEGESEWGGKEGNAILRRTPSLTDEYLSTQYWYLRQAYLLAHYFG